MVGSGSGMGARSLAPRTRTSSDLRLALVSSSLSMSRLQNTTDWGATAIPMKKDNNYTFWGNKQTLDTWPFPLPS